MLINSVILLLRDALPVLLFISILSAVIDRDTESMTWLYKAVGFGAVGIFIVSNFINPVSELADGFGFELMTATMHLLAYSAAVWFIVARKTEQRILLASIATVLLISIHGTNLNIYFSGFWSDPNALDALLMGATLGLGISMSLAILMFYTLQSSILEHWPKLPLVVLALAAARQVTEAAYFLIQADWLPTEQPLWNTSQFLSDSSEFGHFFNALTGYEASPSSMQISIHAVALLVPVIIIVTKSISTHQVKEATS